MLRHRATQSCSFRKLTSSFTREHRHWGNDCYLEVGISNFREGQLVAPCLGGHSQTLKRIVKRRRRSCVSLARTSYRICSTRLESQVSMQHFPPLMYGFCSDYLHFSFHIWPQTTSGKSWKAYYFWVCIWMYLLLKKKVEKHLPRKISLSSLIHYFNLIVWHSHSQKETLHGKKSRQLWLWNGWGPGSTSLLLRG